MDDKGFRDYLKWNGAATEAGRNTRVHAVRKIESSLAELGFEHADLDEAYRADRFEALRAAVKALRVDALAGGQRYRILMPESENPKNRLASWNSWLAQYGRFIGWRDEGPAEDTLFDEGMERLKETFLQRMSDFEDFYLDEGEFWDTEKEYKQEAHGRFIFDAADRESPPVDVGRKVYKTLCQSTRQGLPLSWRTEGEVAKASPELQDQFYGTVARLAQLAADDLAGLEQCARSLEDLREKGIAGLKRGEVLGIAISIFGTRNSSDACWFKVRTFDRLSKMLLGRKLFPSPRFEIEDFEEFRAFMFRIRDRLNDWEWKAYDLTEVQGFIWVAMAESWGDEQPGELTRQAVEGAMDECEEIGVAAFLTKYGFGKPQQYWTRRESNGPLFPAKATVGAAYGHMPGGKPQSAREFHSGYGEQAANSTLKSLGFEIVTERGTGVATINAPAAQALEPVNLILYGPPGTGKTYATAEEAVKLCNGGAPGSRSEVMAEYHALFRKGRIGFVTFHQSYSYEEFVEGLRPDTGTLGDEGAASGTGFSLRPHDGVFKQIANLAAENRGRALAAGRPVIDRSQRVFKMSLGRAGIDDHIFEAAIDGNYVVLGWGGEVDWSDSRFDEWEAIRDHWRQDHPEATGNDPNVTQTYTLRVNMQVGSLVVISDGNSRFRAIGEITGPYEFIPGPNGEYNHRRPVRWLWHSDESLPRERIYGKGFSMVSAYQLNSRYLDWDALEQVVLSGGEAVETTGVPEPYVLIIDEINRANISKVFGELITLLEADKRIDGENELRVKLPYSGETFGIPMNLHVIGTMNTADRSIALLDTALRRRFAFRELMPDASVLPGDVDGVPLRNVLVSLNERIEYLFDREHQIGHAYLLGCTTRDDVDERIRHRVIPLLAEYFYEDWSKVAAVLGDNDGTRFLEKDELTAPDGIDLDGDAPSRWRWSVRAQFSPDAYSAFA